MRESHVEEWLGNQLKQMGGLWLKFVSPGHAGVPDRILLLGGKVFFVEMKTDTGKLSVAQSVLFAKMNRAGQTVHEVYGKGGAEVFLALLRANVGFEPGKTYTWRGAV